MQSIPAISWRQLSDTLSLSWNLYAPLRIAELTSLYVCPKKGSRPVTMAKRMTPIAHTSRGGPAVASPLNTSGAM
jgi:hypothetical protein